VICCHVITANGGEEINLPVFLTSVLVVVNDQFHAPVALTLKKAPLPIRIHYKSGVVMEGNIPILVCFITPVVKIAANYIMG
jgi:hypothetical protein